MLIVYMFSFCPRGYAGVHQASAGGGAEAPGDAAGAAAARAGHAAGQYHPSPSPSSTATAAAQPHIAAGKVAELAKCLFFLAGKVTVLLKNH